MSITKAASTAKVDASQLGDILVTPSYMYEYGEWLSEQGAVPYPPTLAMWLCYCCDPPPYVSDMYNPRTDEVPNVGIFEGEDLKISTDFDWPEVNPDVPKSLLRDLRLLALDTCIQGWANSERGRADTFTNVSRVYKLLVNVALLMPYSFAMNVAGFSGTRRSEWKKKADDGSATARVISEAVDTAEQLGISQLHQRTLYMKHPSAQNGLKVLERRYPDHYSTRSEQVVNQTNRVLPQDMTEDELKSLLAEG